MQNVYASWYHRLLYPSVARLRRAHGEGEDAAQARRACAASSPSASERRRHEHEDTMRSSHILKKLALVTNEPAPG